MSAAQVEDAVQERLRSLLQDAGISQEELARRLRHLGAKTGSSLVSLWMSGGREVSFYSLAAIALAIHENPLRCLRWLVYGGQMPAASYERRAAALGLSLAREPARPLSEEAHEMRDAIARAVEFTLRENNITFENSRALTSSLLKLAEALEDANQDATHLWQAISYIKVREAELKRERLGAEGGSAPRLSPARGLRRPQPPVIEDSDEDRALAERVRDKAARRLQGPGYEGFPKPPG
jgi:transcriptional regulator with XRE-family HTH domain